MVFKHEQFWFYSIIALRAHMGSREIALRLRKLSVLPPLKANWSQHIISVMACNPL